MKQQGFSRGDQTICRKCDNLFKTLFGKALTTPLTLRYYRQGEGQFLMPIMIKILFRGGLLSLNVKGPTGDLMNNTGNPWRIVGMIGSAGMEIIFLTIGGAWLGNKLDAVWGTKPFMLLAGVLLGLVFGFISSFFTIKAMTKE